MTMKASTAIRLDTRFLKWINEITNRSEPSVCWSSSSFHTADVRSEDQVFTIFDCRIYRDFINLTSIRKYTMLVITKEECDMWVQILTLHREKEACYLKKFKPVQDSHITQQYNMVLLAINEQDKFLRFLDCESWQPALKTNDQSMLSSTIMD